MIDYTVATDAKFQAAMTVAGQRDRFEAVLRTTRLVTGLLDDTKGAFYIQAATTRNDPANRVYALGDIQLSPTTRQYYIPCVLVHNGLSQVVYVLLKNGGSPLTTLGYQATAVSYTQPK